MRDSLTVLAIALILVLTAALVGPYFVDWSAQRGWIEAQLTPTLGAPARILGSIDLKLLPTPYFVVEDIELGDPASAWRLTARKLRLEIAIAPLLHGDVDFVEARLEAPRLELTLGPGASLPLPPREYGIARRLRFEKIRVANGAILVNDPAKNRSLTMKGLDFEAEADSLYGPFKAHGALDIEGERTPFRFTTGAAQKGEMKLKLFADARGSHPSVSLDGQLSLRPGGQNFTGAATFEGAESAWRAAGQLTLDAERAALIAAELRIGGEERAISAKGEAEFDFSGAPKASVTLHSDALDLDLWQSSGGDPHLFLENLNLRPPAPLALSYSAQTLTLGGVIFSDIAANLVFGDRRSAEEAPTWLRFEAEGPGKSRLFLDGQWRAGAEESFDGTAQASAEDASWIRPWLRPLAPQWTPDIVLGAVDLSAKAHLSQKAIELRDLDLRLSGSRFSGALAYQPPSRTQPSRFDADLATPSFDLGALPGFDLRAFWTRSFGSSDGSLRLDADALTLGEKESIGALNLDFAKSGDQIALNELTFEGSDGAVVTASGLFSSAKAHLDAKVTAPRAERLAALVARSATLSAGDHMLSRVGALSAIDLSLSADAVERNSALALSSLAAKGSIGGAKIEAFIESDPKREGHLTMSASADAKEAMPLLRLAGVPLVDSGGLGPAHVEMQAAGLMGQETHASIKASLGAASLAFDGELRADLTQPSIKGRLRFSSADAAPLMRVTGVVFPDFAAKVPATLSSDIALSKAGFTLDNLKANVAGSALSGSLASEKGDRNLLTGSIVADTLPAASLFELVLGAPEPAKSGSLWSGLSFAPAAFDLPAARLALTIHNMALPAPIFASGMAAKDVRMSLSTSAGFLDLQDLRMDIGGGRLAGEIKLRRAGEEASLESHLDLADISLDLPAVRARVSGAIDAVGTGKSPDALASGLAGSGHVILFDLTIPNADPAALARVFATFDQEGHSLEAKEIAAALANELKRADFKAGSRAFDVAIASGMLHLAPPADGNLGATVAGSFDLRQAILTERLNFVLSALPKDWSGPAPDVSVVIKGPLSAPGVQIDAAALANALSSRAILRESARIESYEFDAHERAFFYQRLRSERRRERERNQAAEDAGAAQTPPRPAD
ncbi:AsmA family protein [Methylocella tundrae]|uniref:AsmA family protein n=1 Tax=Methylocella tundrae TaxID=227605 RepID=UPI0030FE40BC|nr:AsmA family protein [Methylocella tundrae]